MRPVTSGLLTLSLSLLSGLVLAEGRIQGQVVNAMEKQTVVYGAGVSLYRSDTGKLVALASTDAEGKYSFEGVAAGGYAVEASSTGFKPFMRKDLQVRDDRTLRLNLELLPNDLSRY